MTLAECMSRVSQREFMLWQLWEQEEWNTPDRSDHYLMQIALEVRRVLAQNRDKSKFKLEDTKIPFKWVKPQTPEQKVDQSIRTWKARVGFKEK